MIIRARRYDKYVDINVSIENAEFDMGFHDKTQALDLVEQLIDGADDIIREMDLDSCGLQETLQKIKLQVVE